MPIRKEFRKFYRGQAWRETRHRILNRAHGCCEQCGIPHHFRIIRAGGYWWDVLAGGCWRRPDGTVGRPPKGLRRRIVAIVLTIAHLNNTPGDDRPNNLMALCQWCHLNLDRPLHLTNSRITRSIRKDRARPLLQEEIDGQSLRT